MDYVYLHNDSRTPKLKDYFICSGHTTQIIIEYNYRPMYLQNISEIGVINHKAHKIPVVPEHLETLPEKCALANK